MNLKRLLISLALGTLCYVSISYVFGESGLFAEKQLRAQKDMLVANINKIQSTHDALILKQIALNEDMEVIASYAKQIGYISEGETLLKISGIPNSLPKQLEMGKKYLKTEIIFIDEWICKACGIFCFILIYCILLLFSLKPNKEKIQNRDQKQEVLYAYT